MVTTMVLVYRQLWSRAKPPASSFLSSAGPNPKAANSVPNKTNTIIPQPNHARSVNTFETSQIVHAAQHITSIKKIILASVAPALKRNNHVESAWALPSCRTGYAFPVETSQRNLIAPSAPHSSTGRGSVRAVLRPFRETNANSVHTMPSKI